MFRVSSPTKHRFDAFWHTRAQPFVEPTASPPDKPQKVWKTCFLCRDFREEKWDWFGFKTDHLNLKLCGQLVSVAPQLWRLQFKISAPCFCHTLFWPFQVIINHNLNVSHSTRFLLFLSDRQVSPKFKKTCLEFLHPQSTDSMRSDTRVHNLL